MLVGMHRVAPQCPSDSAILLQKNAGVAIGRVCAGAAAQGAVMSRGIPVDDNEGRRRVRSTVCRPLEPPRRRQQWRPRPRGGGFFAHSQLAPTPRIRSCCVASCSTATMACTPRWEGPSWPSLAWPDLASAFATSTAANIGGAGGRCRGRHRRALPHPHHLVPLTLAAAGEQAGAEVCGGCNAAG